jgi:hypothetical protein
VGMLMLCLVVAASAPAMVLSPMAVRGHQAPGGVHDSPDLLTFTDMVGSECRKPACDTSPIKIVRMFTGGHARSIGANTDQDAPNQGNHIHINSLPL